MRTSQNSRKLSATAWKVIKSPFLIFIVSRSLSTSCASSSNAQSAAVAQERLSAAEAHHGAQPRHLLAQR